MQNFKQFSDHQFRCGRGNRMSWLKFLPGSLLLFVSGIALSTNLAVTAEMCSPLAVVGGEGTQVRKTVDPPKVPISIGNLFRTNWNTDFVVPSLGTPYTRYVSTVAAEDDGDYKVKMFLKYNDDTADEVYNETVNLTEGESIEISGAPRTDERPYQVNIFVGDLVSVGKTYTVSVDGCR